MSLIAKIPILYRSTQFKPGDILPADNSRMVEAWLEAGSAAWDEAAAAPEAPAGEPAEDPAEEPAEKPKPAKKKTGKKK